MTRLRLASTAAILAFSAGLVLAPVFAQDKADPKAAAGDKSELYQQLNLFGDVLERIRRDYVEPVDEKTLMENAINGMLAALDPHSSYMNPKVYKDMQVQTRGEFGGLGIEVTMENGVIKVVSPIDDTPASKAGIQSGDLIFALDGEPVQGLTLQEAVEKIRGKVGTPIKLSIRRDKVKDPIDVSLTRETIKVKAVKFTPKCREQIVCRPIIVGAIVVFPVSRHDQFAIIRQRGLRIDFAGALSHPALTRFTKVPRWPGSPSSQRHVYGRLIDRIERFRFILIRVSASVERPVQVSTLVRSALQRRPVAGLRCRIQEYDEVTDRWFQFGSRFVTPDDFDHAVPQGRCKHIPAQAVTKDDHSVPTE